METLGHMWMNNLTIQYYSMQMPRVIPDQVSEKVLWVMVWNAFQEEFGAICPYKPSWDDSITLLL